MGSGQEKRCGRAKGGYQENFWMPEEYRAERQYG